MSLIINPGETTLYHFAVLEDYELSEGRSPGETTLSDIHAVLARRKDMCDKMVLTCLNLAHIPSDFYMLLLLTAVFE